MDNVCKARESIQIILYNMNPIIFSIHYLFIAANNMSYTDVPLIVFM